MARRRAGHPGCAALTSHSRANARVIWVARSRLRPRRAMTIFFGTPLNLRSDLLRPALGAKVFAPEGPNMFTPEIYRSRRRVLAEKLNGIGLFPANPPSPMNYAHNPHPYVQ